jgi:hypothetical protein
MSEAADNPAFEEVQPEAAPPPINSVRGMILEPAVRNYLIAGAAALAMVFLIMLSNGSDIGGFLLAMLGALGILFRWPATPTFFLLILLYFLVFPFGDPFSSFRNIGELRRGNFRVADVLLVFSVITYLACHYRVYAIAANGLPYEPRRGKKHARRPVDLVSKGEIPRFLWLAGAVVLVGQFIWLLTTSVDIDVNDDFPLHIADDSELYGFRRESGAFPLWVLRLAVLFGIGFFGTLLARLVFGYWRLRLMSPAEGGLMLQEADWSETHRERVRIEKWRAWQQAKNKKQREAEEKS